MAKKKDSPDLLKLKGELDTMLTVAMQKLSDVEKHNWLRHLHGKYTERFLKDNDRIWAIGSIIIPLSLAGLAALHYATRYTVWPLAIGSIMLFFFWLLFAENHRAFQNYSLQVTKAIERQIEVQINGLKVDGILLSRLLNVQKLRWGMFAFVVIVWVGAIYMVYYNKP